MIRVHLKTTGQQQDQLTKDNSNKLTNNMVIGVIKYRL